MNVDAVSAAGTQAATEAGDIDPNNFMAVEPCEKWLQ